MVTLLRLPSVQQLVPLSKSQIYKMIAKDEFPSPIKIAERVSAWPSNEIDTWILEQLKRESRTSLTITTN